MYKQRCITKEKYDELLTRQIPKNTRKRLQNHKINEVFEDNEDSTDLSLGDDHETFVTNIKHDGMTKETSSYEGEYNTFLLCLLAEMEKERLDQKDREFMKTFYFNNHRIADVSKTEWESSESDLKFAKSICTRKTYFIESLNEISGASFNSNAASSVDRMFIPSVK